MENEIDYPVGLDKFIRKIEWKKVLFNGGKKLIVAETKFTAAGVPSTVLTVWHNGEPVESFWGLPQALEYYIKL